MKTNVCKYHIKKNKPWGGENHAELNKSNIFLKSINKA